MKKEVEYYVVMYCMVLLILLSTLQIFSRFLLNFSLSWTEELSRYLFILMVYVGMSLGFKHRRHVRVEIIDLLVPPNVLKHINTVGEVIVIVVLALIGYSSIAIVKNAYASSQTSPALMLPMFLVYSIIPVMFAITIVRIVQVILARYGIIKMQVGD